MASEYQASTPAYLFMLAVLWLFRGAGPRRANRGFRWAQIGSGAAMAFGHGTQDAQKTMGVIALALFTSGRIHSFYIPFWVVLAAALAISLGTYAGGYRIMRTLGRRVIQLPTGRRVRRAERGLKLVSWLYSTGLQRRYQGKYSGAIPPNYS